jgi:hypothetical protein
MVIPKFIGLPQFGVRLKRRLMMGNEYRYTDRDVRENPRLTRIAYDYLSNYGGDFEPLVSALQEFERNRELPTNAIRVVLNCMRHDLNVANDLPAPIGYKIPRKIAEVVKPRKRDWNEPVPCELSEREESHDSHTYRLDDEFVRCEGIPWEINRKIVSFDATVKVPFARARGGRLIHSLTGEGWCEWFPPIHGHTYGWGKIGPFLTVKLTCQYPSIIKKPILLTEGKARILLESVPDELAICPHCTEVAIKNAACRQEDPLRLLCEGRDNPQGGAMCDAPEQGADMSEAG